MPAQMLRWNATTGQAEPIVGFQGATGSQGVKGSTGSQGAQGIPGSIAAKNRGTWTASTAYLVDDVVSYGGAAYVCTAAHTSSTSLNLANFRVLVPGPASPGVYDLFQPNWWFSPGANSGSNAVMTNNTLRAVPMFCAQAGLNIGRLALELTVAGVGTAPVLRFGIYNDTGTGFPGTLILDGGTVAATSANMRMLSVATTSLGTGPFWLAAAAQGCDTTAPQCRAVTVIRGAGMDDSTFTGGGSSSASVGGVQHNGTVSASLPGTFVVQTGFGSAPAYPRVWMKCV